MKIQYNKYKDSHPHETIMRIKNILLEMGISTYEKKWNTMDGFMYSVAIGIEGSELQTNGKGTTREYALASGYAELMERIQTGRLFKRYYSSKKNIVFNYSDEIDMDFTEIIDLPNSECIFKNLLSDFEEDEWIAYGRDNNISKIPMLPFYNVNSNRLDYFPLTLHEKITDTNGLAAGNTAEEAIIQGISEVFERYVTKRIFKDNIVLPHVPKEDCKGYEFYNIIKHLESIGIEVIIKDCTLGGQLPVMGILLLRKDNFKYFFKLGAAPSIEIAIERCLTESFQGFSSNNFHNRFTKIKIPTSNNWYQDFHSFIQDGRGNLPANIFKSGTPFENYKQAFFAEHEFISNKAALNHLVNNIKRNHFTLYVRDYSFLGFPTYQVYIPGITEAYIWKHMLAYSREVRVCQKICNIKKCTDLRPFSDYLEYIIRQSPHRKSITLQSNKFILKQARLMINNHSEFVNIDLRMFLTLLYLKQGNIPKAINILSTYIQILESSAAEDLSYHYCMLALLHDKVNEDHSNAELLSFFSKDKIERVNAEINNTDDVFALINLPECPDCKVCRINKDCFVVDWEKIITKMSNQEKLKKIDQLNVAKLFEIPITMHS